MTIRTLLLATTAGLAALIGTAHAQTTDTDEDIVVTRSCASGTRWRCRSR